LEGGVIDQDIQVAELLHRPPHECLAVRLAADIPGDRERLSPGVAYQARGLRCVLILAQVGDRHIGPLAGEGKGHRPPDPGIAPGDQRHLAGEAIVAVVGLLAVVGDRPHRARAAGRGLLLLREGRFRPLFLRIAGLAHHLLLLSPPAPRRWPTVIVRDQVRTMQTPAGRHLPRWQADCEDRGCGRFFAPQRTVLH